ncbi:MULTISPECIES: ATP-grasp domain-containing protein [Mycolicibacterium]|uniref:Formate-dependent phosphoribosylglycinamide formyltransferase n=1 Tax=Mycolicibacterium gilvum (strain PYR-GCK) TaxID=350054 RepID=A4T154_MYCGI|nr:ATP-grasp domain-containing protein [Mycolicibacterium sp. PAM1]ABP42717.1 formate-dependent phosphoribosylglycinamide formyltransferase [Mycolicibacterium gilvum PYR-GCK]MBV5245284.1 ATP-grasp domain-containing protein [Mycolicibacterium sp. PAM1]
MTEMETAHEGRTVVLLLGAGERTRELAPAFEHLGAQVVTADAAADAQTLTALIEQHAARYVVADLDTAEATNVATTGALHAIADRDDVEVFPTLRSIRFALDGEALRRLAADELGLPTAPFWFAGTVEELTAIGQHAGFPLVVKPVSGAPGEGESVLLRPEDVEPAWQRAVAAGAPTRRRVIAESVVEVDVEVTLLTVRTAGPAGPTVSFCEPIGHHQSPEGSLESWQPQQLSPVALDSAKSIAARIVNSLGGRGVFAVELLVRGDEVYFSDVRPRLQDSGLVTLRSQRLSQFELHARAVLGLPVDTIMISPGAAEVTCSADADARLVLGEALAVAESDVRVLRSEPPVRVSLATAPDPIVARDRARRVASALRRSV